MSLETKTPECVFQQSAEGSTMTSVPPRFYEVTVYKHDELWLIITTVS